MSTKILVVDDELKIVDLVRLYLERAGYKVTIAGDVRAHGGDIWAENNNGPGATFSFTLPLASTEQPRILGRATAAG